MREYKLVTFWAACTFLFCSGVLTNNRQMYWMATTLLLIIAGSYWLARQGTRSLEARRDLQQEAWEGEETPVTLTLKSNSRFPRLWLRIRDRLPSSLQENESPVLSAQMQSQEPVTVHYTFQPQGRGVHTLGPLEVASSDPIGLFFTVSTVPVLSEIFVYPRPVPIPNWEWSGGGGYHVPAQSNAARQGEGMEWHGVREYVPGDPLRRVDWRATARQQMKWHVKEFEVNALSRIIIAIDTSLPFTQDESVLSAHEQAFEQIIRHATWLSLQCIQKGLPVRLVGAGWQGAEAVRSTSSDRMAILRALATIQRKPAPSMIAMLPQWVQEWGRQGSLYLFSAQEDPALLHKVKAYQAQGVGMKLFAGARK